MVILMRLLLHQFSNVRLDESKRVLLEQSIYENIDFDIQVVRREIPVPKVQSLLVHNDILHA
jgi:hypothetical protein